MWNGFDFSQVDPQRLQTAARVVANSGTIGSTVRRHLTDAGVQFQTDNPQRGDGGLVCKFLPSVSTQQMTTDIQNGLNTLVRGRGGGGGGGVPAFVITRFTFSADLLLYFDDHPSQSIGNGATPATCPSNTPSDIAAIYQFVVCAISAPE